MKRYISLLGFSLGLSVFSFIAPASAGFEWMPPAQNPVQAPVAIEQQPLQYRAQKQNQIQAHANSSGGFPAAHVEAQPLGAQSPTSILPESYEQSYQAPRQPSLRSAPQQVRNLSGQGLQIDPYPLRNLETQRRPMELSEDSVQQAMAEEARLLNPLKLGAGLKTGAQPRPAVMPTATGRLARVPRAPSGFSGGGSRGASGGLTPMVGGEPAPLPGMAGRLRAPMQATPIMNYAQAVGFGRDLPLALALSQVIPSDFSHAYADGVDAGTSVSWEGGKPWNEVLNTMLRARNLTASIQGRKVMIQPMARL